MRYTLALSIFSAVLWQQPIVIAQVIAGTPEDKLFQQILSEPSPDQKLKLLMDFETRFPQSKVLPDIFLMAIDLYREKGDRAKIIEYGEKTLKADQDNVTAMIALSRNYAMGKENLDRAVTLAEQAVTLVGKMKVQAVPAQYSESQWKNYVQGTEESARSILEYAKSIRGR